MRVAEPAHGAVAAEIKEELVKTHQFSQRQWLLVCSMASLSRMFPGPQSHKDWSPSSRGCGRVTVPPKSQIPDPIHDYKRVYTGRELPAHKLLPQISK